MLEVGFIKPVEITNCISPMVLVKKNKRKLRVCVDYEKLNACTQNDHFSLLFITIFSEEVGGHARYTFIDSYASYNQIAIALQDIHKTIFTTIWGTFVWMAMPFGLFNVPATFQRLVMYIFTDLLYKSMIIFIDDFSIQSKSSQHLGCVRETLVRCRQMQLTLNPGKDLFRNTKGRDAWLCSE